MNEKPLLKRRRYFIDKKFQTSFIIDFLLIIVLATLALMLLFLYYSQDTLTVGYTGSEVKLLHTSDFFLPTLLLSSIVITILSGIVGTIVLILISHRIAGPLYRFAMILNKLCKGDLTGRRIKLRAKDQFSDLADSINTLTEVMNADIGTIKTQTAEIIPLVSEVQRLSATHPAIGTELELTLQEITEKLSVLQDAANHFKTSDQK